MIRDICLGLVIRIRNKMNIARILGIVVAIHGGMLSDTLYAETEEEFLERYRAAVVAADNPKDPFPMDKLLETVENGDRNGYLHTKLRNDVVRKVKVEDLRIEDISEKDRRDNLALRPHAIDGRKYHFVNILDRWLVVEKKLKD